MRNGTRSNKLTLIDGVSGTTSSSGNDSPPAQDYSVANGGDSEATIEATAGLISPVLVLFTVSLACASAALVAGSYALWLSRQQAARQTLTDVQDILKRCQERMHQIEDDIYNLPNAAPSVN